MTLKEIAAELGVSPSTVSRVVNGYSKNFSVVPEVREKILEKVRVSGYRANPVFSTIRSRRNRQIAFLFAGAEFATHGTVLSTAIDAMARELFRHKYDFNYSITPGKPGCGYQLPPWRAAGLIIPNVIEPGELNEIERSGIPYMVFNGVAGALGSAVMSDETYNTRLLLDRLTALGHRRILYVNFPPIPTAHYSLAERRNAFLEYRREKGLPELPEQRCFTPEELETTIRAIVTFRATAAVCYESGSARKLLYAAWRHGIRIPEQCSIAAFNDEEMLDYTIPPLPRIRIPAAEMGTETVRQLMNRISEKVEPKGSSLRFRGTLVEGGSIAPPPRE